MPRQAVEGHRDPRATIASLHTVAHRAAAAIAPLHYEYHALRREIAQANGTATAEMAAQLNSLAADLAWARDGAPWSKPTASSAQLSPGRLDRGQPSRDAVPNFCGLADHPTTMSRP